MENVCRAVLTFVTHLRADELSGQGHDLAGGFIAAALFNKPQVGLQHEIGVGLVLILKRSGRRISHLEAATETPGPENKTVVSETIFFFFLNVCLESKKRFVVGFFTNLEMDRVTGPFI